MAAPSSVPFVSGRREEQNAVIKCTAAIKMPTNSRRAVPSTRNGQKNALNLAIAFAAL